ADLPRRADESEDELARGVPAEEDEALRLELGEERLAERPPERAASERAQPHQQTGERKLRRRERLRSGEEVGRGGRGSPFVNLPEVPVREDVVEDQIGASKSASQRERSSSIG